MKPPIPVPLAIMLGALSYIITSIGYYSGDHALPVGCCSIIFGILTVMGLLLFSKK